MIHTPKPSTQLKLLTSGQLGIAIGLSRGAIRLYEKYGLITPERRTSSGYRVFSADTVVTLNAIKVACKAGFTLSEVGDLLGIIDAEPFSSAAIKRAIKLKIEEVEVKIDHLNQFKRFMQRVSKKPEMLLDPACDAMLDLAMLAASTDTKTDMKQHTTATTQSLRKTR